MPEVLFARGQVLRGSECRLIGLLGDSPDGQLIAEAVGVRELDHVDDRSDRPRARRVVELERRTNVVGLYVIDWRQRHRMLDHDRRENVEVHSG